MVTSKSQTSLIEHPLKAKPKRLAFFMASVCINTIRPPCTREYRK